MVVSGNATGMGVNLNANSDVLMVYFEQGGACWDGQSCGTAPGASAAGISAVFLDGFGENEFNAMVDLGAETGVGATPVPALLRPDDADLAEEINPFFGAQRIYFPYCTGDVFAGAQQAVNPDTGILHAGESNVELYIDQLITRYKNSEIPVPKQVFLVGVSAGGYGALFNAEKFSAAFDQAFPESAPIEVHVMSDGGLIAEHNTDLNNTLVSSREAAFKSAWGVAIPEGCIEGEPCSSLFGIARDILDRLALRGNATYAVMSFEADQTIAGFLNYLSFDEDGNVTGVDTATLACNRHNTLAKLDQDYDIFYYFSVPETGHIMIEYANLPWVQAAIGEMDAEQTLLGLMGISGPPVTYPLDASGMVDASQEITMRQWMADYIAGTRISASDTAYANVAACTQ